MRLTGARLPPFSSFVENPPLTSTSAGILIAATLAAIAVLDRATSVAPVQHLYYLPIIFAAIRFGGRGGILTAVMAIVFYHLANPHALTLNYEESDFFQVAVFIAVGIVAARLAGNSRRLHRLAMTDDLTGLHNLRSFELKLRSMIPEAGRTNTPLSILVLDVDRLKPLNDTHGHLAGAEAVRTVGQILAANLPADASACRFGGDEFVIAVPRSKPDATTIATELCRRVNALAPILAGISFPAGTLSISIGVACRTFGQNATFDGPAAIDAAGEALFRAADTALYAAKSGGRNRISVA
jgi:diguanylate cyclase (GGDEF)-like protein